MRCAIFIAIACVALSAASFEEPKVDEELFLANNKVAEEYEESLIKSPVEINSKDTNVLTEEDLMMKGPYWKWTSKFKTKADGKYRLRKLMAQHGQVAKRDWVLIESTKNRRNRSRARTKSEEEIMVQAQGQAGWWRRRRRHRHRRHRHRRHRHRRHRHRRFLSRLHSRIRRAAKRIRRGVRKFAKRFKHGCRRKCYGRVCAYECGFGRRL